MNKKIVALIVGLGLTVSLAACKGGGDKPPAGEAGGGGAPAKTEPAKTEPKKPQ